MDDALVGILILVLGVAFLVFYIKMLINAAKTAQWGWFVVMLLFGITSILYYFVGRKPVASAG